MDARRRGIAQRFELPMIAAALLVIEHSRSPTVSRRRSEHRRASLHWTW
jgi:hypothetical protein